MKKPISKADIRCSIEQEIANYLQHGGEVTPVPRGTSGRDPGAGMPFQGKTLFTEPPQPRTLVPEVIAAIDARRKEKTRPSSGTKRTVRRKRKTLYDDFGEPLREVWVEE